MGWPVVNQFQPPALPEETNPVWTLDKVILEASKLSPTKSEGFVVCDKNYHRLKVKSPAYVALSLLSIKNPDDMNAKHILQICKAEEGSEFLAYYPQWEKTFLQIDERLRSFAAKIDQMDQGIISP